MAKGNKAKETKAAVSSPTAATALAAPAATAPAGSPLKNAVETGSEVFRTTSKQVLSFRDWCRKNFLWIYLGLILLCMVPFMVYGPTAFLQRLMHFSEKKGEVEKGSLLFVTIFAIITACLPFWPPTMMATGFLMKNFFVAWLINFLAYQCATLASYRISIRYQDIIREYALQWYPKLMSGVKLLESDTKLIVLFRFIIFPLCIKNYLAGGVLKLDVPTYTASCLAHGAWVSLMFGYFGKMSFDVTKSIVEDPKTEEGWDLENMVFMIVSLTCSVCFVGAMCWMYRRELRELRKLTGGDGVGGH